jgi:ribosomal protein S18 acetylase RimI-like enzyme
MSKKILFIVSNAHAIGPNNRRTGNFLPEVAHPYAEFDRAKYQVDFESLNRAWIEKYFEMEPRDVYILTNPDESILQKGGHILIALYNGIVAGVVALIKLNDDTYELSKMGVDENFRRKGIAEALGRAAIQKGKELKGRFIILFSNTKLEPAIQLYRKLGFKEIKSLGFCCM